MSQEIKYLVFAMLAISRNVRPCVCVFVCSLLRYLLNVLFRDLALPSSEMCKKSLLIFHNILHISEDSVQSVGGGRGGAVGL